MREVSPWRIQRVMAAAGADYEVSSGDALESDEPHLRDYWRTLVKRRRLVAPVFLVVLGFGVCLTLFETPLYTAKATLKIEPSDPAVTQLEDLLATQAAGSGPYDYYKTQFALLDSRALASRVITDLGLAVDPIFADRSLSERLRSWFREIIPALFASVSRLLGVARPPEEPAAASEPGVHPRLIDRYRDLLEVNPVKNTRLVEIEFRTPSARLSRDLADAHAAAFIRMSLETRFELTREARVFLDEKLSELKGRVERSEEALNRFRQAHGVVSLEGNENIVVQRMVDLNKRLTDAKAKRLELESLHRMVENKNYQDLSRIIENDAVQRLKATLNTLETESGRVSTIFKPGHPRVVELGKEINDARSRLDVEIRNIVHGIESDYGAARANEEALQAEADQQKQLAIDLKELGIQYTLLQTEADSNRTLFDSVLKRLKETNVSTGVPVSNIQISEHAELALAPSSPRVLRNVLLALGVGLLSGAGLALVLEYLDSTIKTARDVWRATLVPTLGVIPHLNSLNHRPYGYGLLSKQSPAGTPTHSVEAESPHSRELTLLNHPFSVISESYRTIRAALMLAQAEKPPQVILLTSALPGEGKTVMTLNLGIALAQGGHTVLVIDADLRKGRCHELLNLQAYRGLADVLAGRLELEKGVQQTTVDRLFLLPRGARPPNPVELLGSDKMKEVLGALRQRFDFILIDSPPVAVLSDAVELSAVCDAVLLVVRAQQTPMEALSRAAENLNAVHARIVGAALNGIDIRQPEYYDFQSYYTHGYGTGQAEAEKRSG